MRWVPDSSYKIWICESVEDIVRFVLREVFTPWKQELSSKSNRHLLV